MYCWIYRSNRQNEMYLYLQEKDGFDKVPKALLDTFGQPALVMELELHPQRPLAREEVSQVMASLRRQGFYLQMPPEIRPHLRTGEH